MAPTAFEADDILFVPRGQELDPSTPVVVVRHGAYSEEDVTAYQYLLEIGTVAELVEALDELLGAPASAVQRMRAVVWYSEHDAYPSLDEIQ